MRRTVLAGVMVVVLVGVLLVMTGSVRFRVASGSSPDGVYMTALASGLLLGHANWDGTACLWLEGGDRRTAIVWPYRYTAGGWPLGIYDQSGRRLATIGDEIWVGGGMGPDEMHSIVGCSGFTSFWIASPGPLKR